MNPGQYVQTNPSLIIQRFCSPESKVGGEVLELSLFFEINEWIKDLWFTSAPPSRALSYGEPLRGPQNGDRYCMSGLPSTSVTGQSPLGLQESKRLAIELFINCYYISESFSLLRLFKLLFRVVWLWDAHQHHGIRQKMKAKLKILVTIHEKTPVLSLFILPNCPLLVPSSLCVCFALSQKGTCTVSDFSMSQAVRIYFWWERNVNTICRELLLPLTGWKSSMKGCLRGFLPKDVKRTPVSQIPMGC